MLASSIRFLDCGKRLPRLDDGNGEPSQLESVLCLSSNPSPYTDNTSTSTCEHSFRLFMYTFILGTRLTCICVYMTTMAERLMEYKYCFFLTAAAFWDVL